MIIKFFYLVFCGFFLGISIFIPGLSTSLIAVTMGIYQDLVYSISHPSKQIKQNIQLFLPLIIGAIIGAASFVIAFKYLFIVYKKTVYLLFAGLIAGGLPMIFAEVKKYRFQPRYLISGIFALTATLIPIILASGIGQASGGEDITFKLYSLVLIGFAGGVISLIPGMSISTILVVTGLYSELIFATIALFRMDFTYFLPLSILTLCFFSGMTFTSKGIKYLFEKFPGVVNSAVLGFMTGSLIGILAQSWYLSNAHSHWTLNIFALAAGFGITMLFIVMGKAMDTHKK